MIKKIKNIVYDWQQKRILNGFRKGHAAEIASMCQSAGITLQTCDGEDAFLKKWQPLMPNVNIDSYRFYAQFIGNDPNIVPDDLYHGIIEPLLCDKTSLPVYLNKNLYEKVMGADMFPVCVLRNMRGDYMTRDYRDIKMTESLFEKMVTNNERLKQQGRIIIKPAVETGRGKGVRLFVYDGKEWISNDKKKLTLEWLNKTYSHDFIIQECIEPSDFIKQFNPTSYSTCRLFVYRSVTDGNMRFLGGYLRIGDIGSFKDNIGSGGFAIPILSKGKLAHFATNGTRNKYQTVNGIDLKKGEYEIPNFSGILDLAFKGADMNPLNRIQSFDVILDCNNCPHVIEFNLRCQTITTIQSSYKTFFGQYTDEVIEYCKRKIEKGQTGIIPVYLSRS